MRRFWLAGIATLALISWLGPSVPAALAAVPVFEADPLIVTASKHEEKGEEALAAVSVITREEIERSDAQNLMDLLIREPGVFVARQGGMGYAGTVSIRGLGGSPPTEVAVLVDGHPNFMGIMGHVVPSAYQLDNVERIEIVRGPASTLYGSMALGGVINIITRRLEPDSTGSTTTAVGSFDTHDAQLRVGRSGREGSWVATLGNKSTAGDPDFSCYRSSNYAFRGEYDLGAVQATFAAQAVIYHTVDQSEVATIVNTEHRIPDIEADHLRQDFDRRDFDLTFDWDRASPAATGLKIHRSQGEHTFADGYHSTDYVQGVLLNRRARIGGATLVLGADHQCHGGQIFTPAPIADTFRRQETALYAVAQQPLNSSTRADLGLRWHKSQGFDAQWLPQLGIVRRLDGRTTARLSARRGYRVPSFRELFLFGINNPSLEPEDLWQYEIGAARALSGGGSFDLSAFLMDADNLIQKAARPAGAPPGPPLWWANEREVRFKGIEAGLRRPLSERTAVFANCSYLDAGDDKAGTVRWKTAAGVDHAIGRFTVSVDGLYASGVYGLDADGAVARVPDYFVADARIKYRYTPQVALTLGVTNLFDRDYRIDPAYPYDMPGRAFTLGMDTTF